MHEAELVDAIESGGEASGAGGPLDVLAQVASETLKREPGRGGKRGRGGRPKYPTRKRFVSYHAYMHC